MTPFPPSASRSFLAQVYSDRVSALLKTRNKPEGILTRWVCLLCLLASCSRSVCTCAWAWFARVLCAADSSFLVSSWPVRTVTSCFRTRYWCSSCSLDILGKLASSSPPEFSSSLELEPSLELELELGLELSDGSPSLISMGSPESRPEDTLAPSLLFAMWCGSESGLGSPLF